MSYDRSAAVQQWEYVVSEFKDAIISQERVIRLRDETAEYSLAYDKGWLDAYMTGLNWAKRKLTYAKLGFAGGEPSCSAEHLLYHFLTILVDEAVSSTHSADFKKGRLTALYTWMVDARRMVYGLESVDVTPREICA